MSFLSTLSKALGFDTVKKSFNRIIHPTSVGDFFNAFNPVQAVKDYVNDWKDITSDNSATTEANNNEQFFTINEDGSTTVNDDFNNLDNLGIIGVEAALGEIPELARQWNSAEAQKERNWQTEMSNTAYQRSVADMVSAGINPILAYSQGGASSGSGASASGSVHTGASLGNTINAVTHLFKTIMDKDIDSDKAASKAANEAIKLKQDNSAITAKNDYYKSLTRINDLQYERMNLQNRR